MDPNGHATLNLTSEKTGNPQLIVEGKSPWPLSSSAEVSALTDWRRSCRSCRPQGQVAKEPWGGIGSAGRPSQSRPRQSRWMAWKRVWIDAEKVGVDKGRKKSNAKEKKTAKRRGDNRTRDVHTLRTIRLRPYLDPTLPSTPICKPICTQLCPQFTSARALGATKHRNLSLSAPLRNIYSKIEHSITNTRSRILSLLSSSNRGLRKLEKFFLARIQCPILVDLTKWVQKVCYSAIS